MISSRYLVGSFFPQAFCSAVLEILPRVDEIEQSRGMSNER